MTWTKTARRIVADFRKGGGTTGEDVANWLSDACNIIDDLVAQKKAAAERVRWALVHGRFVALVGRDAYTLTRVDDSAARLHLVRIPNATGDAVLPVDMGLVSSTEAGSRRIRAYRAGKWSPK